MDRRGCSTVCRRAPSAVGMLALAWLGGAEALTATEKAPGILVHIVWVDVSRAAPFAAASVKREVAAVLGPLGVTTRFRVAKPGDDLAPGELSVVLLAGEAPPALRQRKVMGAVHTAGGPARAAWIYLPEVMRALAFDGQSPVSLGQRDRRELGLALGRVVAHELLHLVAPQAPHAHGGLMAARLGRGALVGGPTPLDAATRATLSPPRPGRGAGG